MRKLPALLGSYVDGTTTYRPLFNSNLFTTSRALIKIESPAFSNIECKRYFLFSSTCGGVNERIVTITLSMDRKIESDCFKATLAGATCSRQDV